MSNEQLIMSNYDYHNSEMLRLNVNGCLKRLN